MSDFSKPNLGHIFWRDLTVPDADQIQDFYGQVVGWKPVPHDMGEYQDYDMLSPETGEIVTGICHARGDNANLPPQWLVYISVEDVDASARRCVELGGKLIDGPRMLGDNRFCVIQDPAGAVAALIKL